MDKDFGFSKKLYNSSNIPSIKVITSPNEIQRNESINRISIFSRTKSNSKNNSIMFFKKNSNVANSNSPLHSSTRKNRTIHSFDNSYNEVIIKDIYKNQDDGNYTPKLIQKFLQVDECSILKYGLKNSIQDIDFSFCRTCDPNLINPICLACIKVCHSGHKIQKKVFKGEIRCICGERLHCISKKPNLTINNVSCQLGEWYTISKLNFYYNTNDNKCLCMLCYNFCNNDKKKETIKQIDLKKNNKKNLHNCCCNNDDIHQERKVFFEKMENIAHKLDTFEYFNLLHPSQIINMIFLSKNQFNFNYADLNFFKDVLLSENFVDVELIFCKNADFSSTNYYLIFKHLIEFIKWNKYTGITYYCKEAEDYFSFRNAKLVLSLMNIMKYNEKFFWLLSSKFLKLFHKIYIGNLTQSFSKFKLNDLENFSCSQRSLLRNLNKKNFPESQEIINFLIKSLENINLNGFSIIEALDTINIIINILKKLAIYDLFNTGDMIRVIYEIEKILFDVKSIRKISLKINQTSINNNKNKPTNFERMSLLVQKNFEMFYEKEIKLYINIIKLISNFNLSFNDRLIYNALSNVQKYPSLDTINKDTISFSFIKTDLGRAIIRLTLRIVYSIQNAYSKFSYDEKFKYIMNQGMRIFSCYLTTNDIFLLGIMQNIKNVDFYKKGEEIESNDSEYITILKQKDNLEKTYKKFFMFENDLEEVIQEVNHTIDVILGNNKNEKNLKLSDNKILCVLKSNYFFTLSKFYHILNFSETKKEKLPKYMKAYGILKDNEESIEKITNKIFLFFNSFIYKSSDNSLLLMSNYIFNDLCKAPIKYGIKNFELFLESTKNIIKISRIIGNIKNYLNNLFVYLEYLKNKSYSKIIDCLLIYLNIIELLVLNIKTLNPDESIKFIKEIVIEINKHYKIVNNFFENKSIDNDEIGDKYQNLLIPYIKIINSIFDFTIEGEKSIVLSILKTGQIIDFLKNYNTNIVLRTELLEYIRKIYIDLSYDENENSNQIYANSIISIEDNLVLLKTNPLISNFRYPTKLLSFFKDFLNLSVRSETNEKSDKEEIDVNPNKNYTFQLQNTNKNEDESSNLQIKNNEKKIEEIEDENDEDSGEKDSLGFSKSKSSISTKYIKKRKIFKPCFDNNIYELLMNELKNIKEITSDINQEDNVQMDNLRNYFENGLLIPIIFFLKRSFVFSHLFSGKEMILLYDLIIESCKLRLYIAEYKYDFWKEMSEENIYKNHNSLFKDEEENICKIYNNKGYLIDGNFCVNNALNISTNHALNLLKSKIFLCFDFTFLYNVFEENIFSLLKDRKGNIYREFFINEGKEISIKMIKKEEHKLFPDYDKLSEIKKRNIRLYILYKYCKKIISNENNSSLLSILPEICLEHETNYRNLLITFLINICIKADLYNEYAIRSFSILYKLLCLQTSETQNNLINLIGGNDIDENDLGFMTQFAQHLFKSIILLFIELFNPPDKLLDKNYSSSYLLIKIFKYLCEEHNNFFQCRLIKSLQYKYEEIIPIFYKEISKETESKYRSNMDIDNDLQVTYISKNIKFFDFFLHVILKIILISEWDKLDYNNENYHPQNIYLYDIFESILEMLNEIIQGNRPEYLNNLGNTILDNKIEIDNLIDDDEYYLIKSVGLIKISELENEENKGFEKIDHFRYFVKNVTNFIFSDRMSLELLYKIRNNLMEFFTTILEEKNCNDEVQKFVIKYLNINRVFNSISSILKSYYLRESSDEEIQNLLKSLKLEDNNLTKTLYGNQIKSKIIKNGTSNELKKINSTYSEKYGTKIKFDLSSNLLPKTKKNFMRTLRQKEKKIIFNEKLLEYYRNLYFTIKEFNETNEFKLSNAFYKYIKLIISLNKSDEAKQIIEQAQSMSEERAKRKFLLGEPKKIDTISTNKKEIKIVNKLSSKTLNPNIGNKRTIKTIKTNKTLQKKSLFYTNNLDNSELFILNNKKSGIEKEKKNGTNPKLGNAYKKNEKKIVLPLIKENKNEYDKDFIEHYYIIKFFESITTTVEVRTAGAVNQTVIFTQPPEMIYLSNGTKSEFEREVNRDSETSKKNYLIRNVIYFQKEIKYYQRSQSNLSRLVSKVDFLYIQMGSYIYALLFNLFILFTLYGDIKLSTNEIEKESIQYRRTNHKGIQLLIDKSVNQWRYYYDIICYIYVILNGTCIFIWIYFRMPLYYKIDRLKYIEENNIQNKQSLKFCQKFYIILVMTIYDRDYISTLIYEFIFSLIGAIIKRGEIIYAFLLLPIIDLNNILKNIIVSVKLQYNEVCLTFFFAAIIMYAFSNIAYFFFKKDFAQEINYKDDNVCNSLIFCFLNTLDSGLRARGGIGDSAIRLSYNRNKKHYVLRLVVDDVFFLLIVITAIDLVFGIILGAFSTLRNIEQKHSTDRKNHCFICHVNKNTLEKNRQNFNEHRTKIHNLWNYVDYMITLKFSDVHSLNAINSYANEKIENKDISWLPTYKDLKNNEKKNDELEEELKVEDENLNKYFVKTC